MTPNLTFDAAAARTFLEAVYQGPHATPGILELVYDDADGKLTGRARFATTDIAGALAKADELTKLKRRVYFGAGVRSADLPDRPSTNTDVVSWSALVFDFDTLEDAEYGLAKARELGLGFQFVTQTGALRNGGERDLRVQCWVLLDKPCTDMGLVSQVLKAGIAVFGSDKSIHDPRRVMRLPGSVSWARKDGRVDEATCLRDDLSEICARRKIEAVLALLQTAEPAVPKMITEARVAEIRARLEAQGDATKLWRDAELVNIYIHDLTLGVVMNPSLFGLAQAAARDGHSPEEILAALQMLLDQSEAQGTRPDRCEQLARQLPGLVRRAVADAGLGSQAVPYQEPGEEFDALTPDEEATVRLDAIASLWPRYVWVDELALPFDLATRNIRTRTQFNVDRSDVGDPNILRVSAWAVFTREWPTDHPDSPGRRQVATRLTYRPGAGALTVEPDGCTAVNTWTASELKPAVTASDADVAPYLELVRHVMGEHADHFLNYMAHLVQFPEIKINHAILVKSVQGLGKGLMVKPIQYALGTKNCAEVGPSEVASDFNKWLDRKKFVIVDEMMTSERKNAMNKLKPLIASPPLMLQINRKGIDIYEIPNLVSLIFFSNLDSPVLLEKGDRRFYVVDSEAQPMPPEKYDALAAWYDEDGDKVGMSLVARWLLDRRIVGFDARGAAPVTDDKLEMTKAGRSAFDGWLDDCLEQSIEPLDTDVVCIEDVVARMPRGLVQGPPFTPSKMAAAIKKRGGLRLGADRLRLGWKMPTTGNDRASLWAVRRQPTYGQLIAEGATEKLKEIFKRDYQRAGAARIAHDFTTGAAGNYAEQH